MLMSHIACRPGVFNPKTAKSLPNITRYAKHITTMNSFSNSTNLYNHSEPILQFPESGKCSLLTGNDRDNITLSIFQPCCTNATAIAWERSTCTCNESCETCLAQHAEEFKLISAVCNTQSSSGARSKTTVTGTGVLLLAVAPLIIQTLL